MGISGSNVMLIIREREREAEKGGGREWDGGRNRGGGREREKGVQKSTINTLFILARVDFLSLYIKCVCLFRLLLYTRN